MTIYNTIVFILAVAVFVAYACRLGMLKHGAHNGAVIIMHKAFACAVTFAGYDAWTGTSTLGDVATIIAAMAWIAVSYKTWMDDVPLHFWLSNAPKT